MDRKLIDYLPPVLQSVLDIAAIMEAQQPMIENAWSALQHIMDNQFLSTADENGVSVWEKELGIAPEPEDTLENRKAIIKGRLNQTEPHTQPSLNRLLATMYGDDKVLVSVDCLNYLVSVGVDEKPGASTAGLYSMLREYIPANMLLSVTVSDIVTGSLYFGGALQTLDTITFKM